MIAVDMCVGMVVAHTGIQNQLAAKRPTIHHVETSTLCLKVGDNKSPAVSTVVLHFSANTTTQFVMAERHSERQVACKSVLHETPFQCSVGSRHIAMTDRL